MTSGADLFVVCKQCGSEVSPYITECPYCGNRLRRRAPKLPRVGTASSPAKTRRRLGSVFGRTRRRGRLARRATLSPGRWESSRPIATIVLVAASCGVWVAWHARPSLYGELVVFGPLHSHWWRIFTYQFAFADRVYGFVTLTAIAIFGWLVERRHGAAVTLALFFGAGATGALVAEAVYPFPYMAGGNAAALALLAAWAAPDLRAARAGEYYEGDLLAAGVAAALLLALPFAIYSQASWLGGVAGACLGLLVGLGLHRTVDAQP
jgi:membrane associated rhomboid family serine protease